MKKLFTIFVLILFVISLFSVIILAKDDDDSSGKSSDDSDSSDTSSEPKDSGSDDDKKNDDKDDDNGDDKEDGEEKEDKESKTEETKTIIDEQGREVTIETETKMKDGVIVESEEKRTYIDENGNEVVIKTETETDGNSETETKITRSYTAPDGSIVKITEKTEIEDGESETKFKTVTTYPNGDIIIEEQKTKVEDGELKITNSITFKGAEFVTKLKVTAKIEEKDGNFEEKFSVKLSTGAEQPIVSPDQAALVALEVLGTTNGFSIEVIENIKEDGTTTATFKAKAETAGNLFGLPFFKVDIPLETLLDAEGNVIDFKEPWYAPFVTGLDNTEVCQTESSTREVTNTVLITEIKALLELGNHNIGACIAVCGDSIFTDEEICDSNSQACTTTEGYAGTETCNLLCDGFDACVTTESCGDNIINGQEACDDGNNVGGDGCSGSCLKESIEVVPVGDEVIPNNEPIDN